MSIDLTCFSFKLFNFRIQDLILANHKLIVTTTEGDVVVVTADFHEESQNRQIQANRINFISKI